MNIGTTRGLGMRLRTRISLLSLSLGIAFGALPLALSPLAVSADGPTGITFDVLGCQGGESLVSTTAPYLCPDADYAHGNQGKQWNELDLVPMRLVATAKSSAPATQTYQVATVADFMNKSEPGFDFMSVPTLNTRLSDASCTDAAVSPGTGAGATISPGLNNADTSIYRVLSITQGAGTACVYDYYQRLALGSSNFPGSSLHSDLGTVTFAGTTVTALGSIPGVKTVSLPVDPSTAPSLAASLSATQGQGYIWTVSKGATPDPLSIADTCNIETSSRGVNVTVSWQRIATSEGQTTVVAQVFATNATGRTLDATGTAQLLDAASAAAGAPYSFSGVAVPARSSHYLLGTFTRNFPAGASSSYSVSVSGGYTDPITHQTVGSQSLSASASAPVTTVTNNANATAVVTDVASITGAGLRYSIDLVSPPGGSLGGYALGTPTTASVTWTSPTLSGDGSVVLHETVSVTGPTTATGTLDDVAEVTGSSGLATGINLQIPVTTGALFNLTVAASIPNVLQGAETASFPVTVTDAHGVATPASIDFTAGQTSRSTVLHYLAAGTYTVHETVPAGWVAQPDRTWTAAMPTCAGTVSFANAVMPATATVQKITVPAGHEAGWSFTLSGPGTPAGGETVTTTGSGAIAFATALQEGDYTIAETSSQDGWAQASTSGCSFTVDYPADAARAFGCTVTNQQSGVQGITTGTNPTPNPSPAGSTTPTGSNPPGSNSPGSNPPVTTPVTGGQGQAPLSTPNTGADLPYAEAALLVLAGGGLAALGWRRSRHITR